MEEIILSCLGTTKIASIFAALIYGSIGIYINFQIKANHRNVPSEKSPVQWSWGFFWRDNWRNILKSYVGLFLLLRFGQYLIGDLGLGKLLVSMDSSTANAFLSVIYGVISPQVIYLFNKCLPKKDS